VQRVIFEIGKEKWDAVALVYPPIVVFVRSACKQNNTKFDQLFYEPRKESQLDFGDATMMMRLNEIVKKSREAASFGI
jgi:hypothetical protein